MKHIKLASAFVALCAAAIPAFAKAPAATKSAEDLIAKAIQDEIDRKAREAEAQRDPNQELIDGFGDKAKGMPLSEGVKLADLMVRAEKDEKLVPYRRKAGESLVKRFSQENAKDDPAVRDARRDVAMVLIELMKSKEGDALALVEAILKEWYPRYLSDSKFKVDGKPGDRDKAYKEMKKKLKDK